MLFQKQIANLTASILPKISDKQFISMIRFAEKTVIPKKYLFAVRNIRLSLTRKEPYAQVLRKVFNLDKNYRKKMTSWVFDTFLNKMKKWGYHEEKGDFQVPKAILMSPTMRCNLSCKGCYAGKYSVDEDLNFNTVDRIINEGKKMGVFFFVFIGGEPFAWPHLLKTCAKHNDCMFLIFTNGTLISERTTKIMKKLGNMIPAISIEGFEKETDERRGKNVYKRIHYTMSMLNQNKIPFGYSVTVMKKNANLVMSERFVDMMIDKGALMGWYFLYMPVGKNPDMNEMPTPLQRLQLLKQGKLIRQTKPLFFIDFWNDSPYAPGCIAGKYYLHITNKGDVEPCIYSHVAQDNIKNKSLKEVLQSPFFRELRRRQPFNKNLFLPCMWIDNPKVSRELYEKFKLYPTHEGADFILKNKVARKKIDKYAEEMEELYRDEWESFKKKKAERIKLRKELK